MPIPPKNSSFSVPQPDTASLHWRAGNGCEWTKMQPDPKTENVGQLLLGSTGEGTTKLGRFRAEKEPQTVL